MLFVIGSLGKEKQIEEVKFTKQRRRNFLWSGGIDCAQKTGPMVTVVLITKTETIMPNKSVRESRRLRESKSAVSVFAKKKFS